jgi:hypothetical protein
VALKPKPRPAGGRGLLPGETEEDRIGEREAGDEVRSKTSSSSGFGSGSLSDVSDSARLGFSIIVISFDLLTN